MNIQLKEKGILFTDLYEHFEILLRKLPGCEEMKGERARKRLYPDGYLLEEDEEKVKEWRDLVHTDLEQRFQEAQDVVARDIAAMRTNGEGKTELFIPFKHVDAWLNCLNQARISIAAEYNLDEDDLNTIDPSWMDLHRRSA
ncbi:MAG: DUF2017 family protein, partial [Chthoniobacterales bacterium]|nr:DUF2017 family protein [Chthoniobacterales bacterium]